MLDLHVVIGGFTQRRNRWHGMLKLNEKVIAAVGMSSHRRVWFQRWCDPWKQIAEHVWLLKEEAGQELRVFVYAYSWGAGWGAMQFAKHLSDANIKIEVMVISDAVFRHPVLIMRWTAMTKLGTIQIPDNVNVVHRFYQKRGRPMGHKVHWNAIETEIQTDRELHYEHAKMDDASEFHAKVLEVVDDSIAA